MAKTVKYKLENNSKLTIDNDSTLKLEPDIRDRGIGYMQIGNTFKVR